MTNDWNTYVWVVDSGAIDALYKLFGVVMIEFIHHVTDADIRTKLHGLAKTYGSMSSLSPVAVFHVAPIDVPLTVTGGDCH